MSTKIVTSHITKTEPEDVPLSCCRHALAMEYVPMVKETVLYLDSREFLYINGKPEHLLNQWCIASGSSLAGRLEAVRRLTTITKYKSPVMIDETSMQMFFPLRSINAKGENTWLCDDGIMDLESIERKTTTVMFTNGFRLDIPYDYRMIRRQQSNCNEIRQILMEQRLRMNLEADYHAKELN